MNHARRRALGIGLGVGCALFGVAAPFLFAERSPERAWLAAQGNTMGTTYTVKALVPEGYDAIVVGQIARMLDECNARFSTWIDDSTISRFNAHRSTEAFDTDPEFVDVLERGLRIAELTDGAYDPTTLPLLRQLGFENGRIGDVRSIAAARELVGWRKVEILDATRIRKTDPGVEIGLSSIAKGRGVDAVAEALLELDVTDFMVEVGGEVRCAGVNQAGRAWSIAIEKPDEAGRAIQQVVQMQDVALATSGSYRNFHESGGTKMHHVFDARTADNPENGIVSVSILAPDCTLADGLATALMVVGPEHAERVFAAFGSPKLAALFLVKQADGSVREVGVRWRP